MIRLLLLLVALLGAPLAHAREPDVPCTAPIPAEAPPARTSSALGDARSVRVAVIDTGVSPHEQLAQVIPGPDLVTPESPAPLFDCDGHGTAVAGVIASRDLGVAPQAEILAIRHTSAHYRNSAEESTLASLAHSIELAVEHGAHVINLSVVSCIPAHLLPTVDLSSLHRAAALAEENNVVIVAAAGNESSECLPGDAVFPAHLPTVLGVSSLDQPDTLAAYSLPPPEEKAPLAAPGYLPIALSPGGWASGLRAADVDPVRGSYSAYEGTSYAAPVVAGTAALLRQRYPEASAAEIRTIIEQSALPHTGLVDPTRALSHLPQEPGPTKSLQVSQVVLVESVSPRRAALILCGVALVLLVVAAGAGLIRDSPGGARQAKPLTI